MHGGLVHCPSFPWPIYSASSSGGIGILFSMANFFNDSILKRHFMLSSRMPRFFFCVSSMSCHSWSPHTQNQNNIKGQVRTIRLMCHSPVISSIPIRLFARCAWYGNWPRIHDSWAYDVSASCEQFRCASIHAVLAYDSNRVRKSRRVHHRWCRESDTATMVPAIETKSHNFNRFVTQMRVVCVWHTLNWRSWFRSSLPQPMPMNNTTTKIRCCQRRGSIEHIFIRIFIVPNLPATIFFRVLIREAFSASQFLHTDFERKC